MTSSINIQTNYSYEPCIEKCSYNFNYPKTHLTITNNDTYLSMVFLDTADQQTNITYNNADYTVSEIIFTQFQWTTTRWRTYCLSCFYYR